MNEPKNILKTKINKTKKLIDAENELMLPDMRAVRLGGEKGEGMKKYELAVTK